MASERGIAQTLYMLKILVVVYKGSWDFWESLGRLRRVKKFITSLMFWKVQRNKVIALWTKVMNL